MMLVPVGLAGSALGRRITMAGGAEIEDLRIVAGGGERNLAGDEQRDRRLDGKGGESPASRRWCGASPVRSSTQLSPWRKDSRHGIETPAARQGSALRHARTAA